MYRNKRFVLLVILLTVSVFIVPVASWAAEKEQAKPETSSKININTADEVQLKELPGIGPSTAKAIIEYREASGPFKSIEDIQSVKGIGEKKFSSIKDLISVE